MTKQDRLSVVVAVVTALTTVVLSMVLNSWAFTKTLDGWFGHAVGVLLPLWVLALTFMGHRLWDESRKLAAGCYGLAGFALLVSMPHLASGYALLGLNWFECWALAVVTDLTQVAGKLLVITLYDKSIGQVAQPTMTKRAKRKPTIKVAA